MVVWLFVFQNTLSQYVLAWVTERWYFTPYVHDTKVAWKKWKRGAVFKGYAHAFSKHTGTIAAGSLLSLVFMWPRGFFFALAALAKFLGARPVHDCCKAIYNSFAFADKSAFLCVALTSENLFSAAQSAQHMLSSNKFKNIAVLTGMQGLFQVGGLILIAAACLVVTKVTASFMEPAPGFEDQMVYIAVVVSIPVGWCYMTLFDTVGDVMLFCWVVQKCRWNYQVEYRSRAKGSENGDATVLSTFFPSFFAPNEDAEEMVQVRYAPPALQDLVRGTRKKSIFPCRGLCGDRDDDDDD